jgi:photosystem II stability/assembly factor-like uncharacterized protein
MAVFAAAILQTTVVLAATVPAQSVLGVSFSDATHGYLAGGYSAVDGVVAYTSDGGATWKPTQLPNRRTWAVGASTDGSSATASADYFDVAVATTNQGTSWSSGTPVFGGVVGFGGQSHINGVAYLSAGRVAVGQQEGTAANGNVAVIARDSGANWTPDFRPLYDPLADGTPVLTYATLTSIDATAGGLVGWAVGCEYNLPQNLSPKSSLIYRTADGGLTWTSDLATGALLNEITAVTAADSNVAYATYQGAGLGTRYFLRRTGSGTWARSAAQIALGFQANSLDAYDADHLVVVGDLGKVYYTANATNATPTWVPLTTTGSTNNLYGVQMTGPDSWVVVGGNETIVRFINGGANQAGSYGLGNPVPVITSHVPGFSLPAGTISGTASDAGIGVVKVEVLIQRASDHAFWNGTTWVADSNQWRTATGTKTWSYPFASGEASALTIKVRATDGMNLVGQTGVTSTGAPIDLTPPTTSSNAVGTYYNTPGQVITLTRSEAGTTEYRLGGSGPYSTGTSVAVPTTVGSYTLYFRSTDTAGNPESPDKVVTFSVVSAPPVVQSVTVGTWTRVAGKSSVKVRKSYTVSGSISHAAAPGVVTISITRKVGKKWKKYSTPRVGVSNGTYRYSFKPRYRGSYRIVSTYSGGTSGVTTYLSSKSGTKSLKVK